MSLCGGPACVCGRCTRSSRRCGTCMRASRPVWCRGWCTPDSSHTCSRVSQEAEEEEGCARGNVAVVVRLLTWRSVDVVVLLRP